jgi:cytochrome c553
MLVAPDSAERYGKKSSMPSFAEKLTDREVDMLIGWLARQEPRSPNESSKTTNEKSREAAVTDAKSIRKPTASEHKRSAVFRDSLKLFGSDPCSPL